MQQILEIRDVTSLAKSLGEVRRARIGLPIAVIARAALSLAGLGTNGPAAFHVVSAVALSASVVAGAILIRFEPAQIRGRESARQAILAFLIICGIALVVDVVHAAQILNGQRVFTSGEISDDGFFVVMLVLLGWLTALIAYGAWRRLSHPVAAAELAIMARSRPVGLMPRMVVRNFLTCGIAGLVVVGLALAKGLFGAMDVGTVWETIREKGLLTMAGELWGGIERGEPAAIGITTVFGLALLVLGLKGVSLVVPKRDPVNRMWRWARDAGAALEVDERPPVLFLRSFADETATFVAPAVEQAMAASLAGHGPFIAVGLPGEPAPAGDAYRTYLRDDEWRAAVDRWIAASAIIIVALGTSDGLRWELESIRNQGALARTLVVIPGPGAAIVLPSQVEADRRARWSALTEVLRGSPWQAAIERAEGVAGILLVSFRAEGRIAVAQSEGGTREDFEAAVLAALDGQT